jgi:alanyl aminopeptidase
LSEYEATAIMQDASLLERSGLITLERAVETLRRGLEHASPSARRAAAEGLDQLPPAHLKGKGAAMKADLDDTVAVPLAASMGWTERPNESDIVRGLRATLLPYAAQARAGGPLRDEARKLALQWVADRGGADAGMLVPILDTAARYADAATYAKLEAEALRTKDLRERKSLLSALGKVRDPKLQERALARALEQRDGKDVLAGRDVLLFVESALEDDGGRANAFAFVRAHYDALAAKVPAETAGNFARSLDRLCSAADRATFVDFFGERAPKLNGGAKKYRQALDTIDICVASTPS